MIASNRQCAPKPSFADGYRLLREFARKYLRHCGRSADLRAIDIFLLHELPSFTAAAQEALINELNRRHRAE